MIIGTKELDAALAKLSQTDMGKAVEEGIKLVQGEAKSRCPVHEGELRDSIYAEVEHGIEYTIGICYTNKNHAPHVEFGTGPVGQENHKGVSPDSTGSYVQKGWMIPGDAMERGYAESKGLGVVEDKNGNVKGYLTNGQPARPFLYPALKNQEEEIEKIFRKEMEKQI